jgi:fumarylacetoacetase
LQDGDTVSITASAPGLEGLPVGFGSVDGTILPAIPSPR